MHQSRYQQTTKFTPQRFRERKASVSPHIKWGNWFERYLLILKCDDSSDFRYKHWMTDDILFQFWMCLKFKYVPYVNVWISQWNKSLKAPSLVYKNISACVCVCGEWEKEIPGVYFSTYKICNYSKIEKMTRENDFAIFIQLDLDDWLKIYKLTLWSHV